MSTPEILPTPITPPQRANLERRLVRGLICFLSVVLAIEGFAYMRVMYAHWRLSSELRKAELEDHRITKDIVKSILGNRPPDESKMLKASVGEEQYDIYYFQGLLKRRELCVHYGVQGLVAEPEVIEITTIIPDELLAN